MTRGMNQRTVDALRRAVTPADLPVLVAMLEDRDLVTQATAASVLACMPPEGTRVLEAELRRLEQQPTLDFSKFDAIRTALKHATDVAVPGTP